MAKSKNVVFTGRAFWARVYEGNHDEYGGKEFYKITIELDNAGWSKFNQSNLSLKVKPVEEGGSDGVTFKRDIHPKTGVDKKGKKWTLGGGAPRVVDIDGEEFSELIGNGSKVEVLVNLYQVANGPMKGKWGHRLDAVKILEHIPYESPDDEDEEIDEVVEEVKEEAKPSKKAKGLPF